MTKVDRVASLNVLIATLRTDLIGGVENVVRDLALGLERRGHAAFAYSNTSDVVYRAMKEVSVKVIHDLDDLPFYPDVIHGHFSPDTMIALARFPDAAAVFHCHGAGYFGAPPRHPRIYRYLSITPSVALRVMIESGLPESSMEIVPNGVDLRRFSVVREPPARLAKALFYNNYHAHDSATLAMIRKAAAEAGLQLDYVGGRLGQRFHSPHEELHKYDLVFASGLSAIESLASGCAVIVLGMTGCGPMVRRETFDDLRRGNFSVPVNAPPDSAERILAEISRYSAEDCRAVTTRLRQEADLDLVLERTETIYSSALDEHRATPLDRRAETAAFARYMRKLTPFVDATDKRRASAVGDAFSEAALGSIAVQQLSGF